MQTEILAIAFFISGLCLAFLAAGIIVAVVTGIIWHFWPNCKFIKWVNAEVLQEEDLTKYGNVKAGDCISPRGQK